MGLLCLKLGLLLNQEPPFSSGSLGMLNMSLRVVSLISPALCSIIYQKERPCVSSIDTGTHWSGRHRSWRIMLILLKFFSSVLVVGALWKSIFCIIFSATMRRVRVRLLCFTLQDCSEYHHLFFEANLIKIFSFYLEIWNGTFTYSLVCFIALTIDISLHFTRKSRRDYAAGIECMDSAVNLQHKVLRVIINAHRYVEFPMVSDIWWPLQRKFRTILSLLHSNPRNRNCGVEILRRIVNCGTIDFCVHSSRTSVLHHETDSCLTW